MRASACLRIEQRVRHRLGIGSFQQTVMCDAPPVQEAAKAAALDAAAAQAGAHARAGQVMADAEMAAAEKLLAAAQIEFDLAQSERARASGAAFSVADRAESAKAAAVATAGGLAAAVPLALAVAAGGGGGVTELLSFADVVVCCALFGVTYRCARPPALWPARVSASCCRRRRSVPCHHARLHTSAHSWFMRAPHLPAGTSCARTATTSTCEAAPSLPLRSCARPAALTCCSDQQQRRRWRRQRLTTAAALAGAARL